MTQAFEFLSQLAPHGVLCLLGMFLLGVVTCHLSVPAYDDDLDRLSTDSE